MLPTPPHTPCNPPPMRGDRHLAQKAQETLGAEENISPGYTGTGVGGGDRHLVTPPPPRGGTGLTLGGGDYKGGRGYM